MKALLTTYSFNKTARQVIFPTATGMTLYQLLLITNVTSNIMIYNFASPALGGVLANSSTGSTLTLDFDTSLMNDSDVLQIFWDDLTSPSTDTTLFGLSTSIGSSGLPIQPNYISPVDFNVVYTGTNSLYCYGAPFTIDDANIFITSNYVKNSIGNWTKYLNGQNNVSIRSTSNIITLTGVTGVPFYSGDTQYVVSVFYQQKGYDPTIDALKTSEISPIWNRYTDVETLVSSAQNVTASWADFGAEIDVRGYSRLIVYVSLTHNNSVGNSLKALVKHTYAGSDEYELPLKTIYGDKVVAATHYYQLYSDTTQKIMFDFDVMDVPYVQLQIKCSTVGATADTWVASITKMY